MTELTARRAATRERLVDAAVVVFAEKGVLGAAVEEICEAAGFTRGAFYSNFTSKDDLCVELLQRNYELQMAALDQAIAGIDAAPTSNLDDLIARTLDMFFAAQPEGRHWVLASQELRLHAARSPEFATAYRRFTDQGTLRVAETIRSVVQALGYELTTSGPAAIGLLHAVHEYGTLGSLIGSDTLEGGYKERLLAEVLRTLVRPSSTTVR
ncbi:TetR/AcrR family transcriptional regulator [Propioniciclava sinopodophylli]|uniref:TetR/AcrR family transcriptional regulator n=1 Tax=Propioniciclava sinopodophylli TaxID=1837344 RepID=UPI002490FCD1|nr:TetR/AcrR family transcriptional regulator [Propioniciclava sinopodophylli]